MRSYFIYIPLLISAELLLLNWIIECLRDPTNSSTLSISITLFLVGNAFLIKQKFFKK